MAGRQREFADAVLEQYDSMRGGIHLAHESRATKSLQASAAATTARLGHPRFMDLAVNQTASCWGVSAFIDLRRFTARSFWDPAEEVVWLNTAVLTTICWTIQRNGGYALGLRGDGVFAFFGDPRPAEDRQLAAIAVGTTGLALEAIRTDLNPVLVERGMERVQVRAGMDFGEVVFAQIGTPHGCEVNPTGFTSNFAAKCEKKARAWEIVAGQGLAELLPDHLLDRRGERAEEYTRGYSTKVYPHHYVEWEGFVGHMDSIDRQLNGSPASAIGVG